MSTNHRELSVSRQQRDQMLRLVAKGFYNELINYGVEPAEIVRVASHLLDNLTAQERKPGAGVDYYNRLFTLASVTDEWEARRQLSVQHVQLRPFTPDLIPRIREWLRPPGVRESFVPPFPERESELCACFAAPDREYFAVCHEDAPVGIVGGENIDLTAGKLEMKKLVGEAGLQGKGIGKRATFAFLYHTFMIRNLNKVYVHSRDINVSNLNLNSRFGFELEGVFLEDLCVDGKRSDVVRMALFKSLWLGIFSSEPLNESAGRQ